MSIGLVRLFQKLEEVLVISLCLQSSCSLDPYPRIRRIGTRGRARGETGARHTGDDAKRHKALMLELQPSHSFHRGVLRSRAPFSRFAFDSRVLERIDHG